MNIISTAGLNTTPTMCVYAATKNTVRIISEAFLQGSDGNARITRISPGFVDIEFAEHIKNDQERTAILKSQDEIVISPDVIADAIIYAISQLK